MNQWPSCFLSIQAHDTEEEKQVDAHLHIILESNQNGEIILPGPDVCYQKHVFFQFGVSLHKIFVQNKNMSKARNTDSKNTKILVP